MSGTVGRGAVFDPAAFGRAFAAEVKCPQEERAEAYEWAFRAVLRYNPPDAEGRARARIVSRSDVVLTFYSGIGNTPTVTLNTRGATATELSAGIRAAVDQGAPIPHYYAIDGTEEPEVFVCASEEQDTLELMHWAYAFMVACEAQDVRADIACTEYVRATETFTWPSADAALSPNGTYERVIKARREVLWPATSEPVPEEDRITVEEVMAALRAGAEDAKEKQREDLVRPAEEAAPPPESPAARAHRAAEIRSQRRSLPDGDKSAGPRTSHARAAPPAGTAPSEAPPPESRAARAVRAEELRSQRRGLPPVGAAPSPRTSHVPPQSQSDLRGSATSKDKHAYDRPLGGPVWRLWVSGAALLRRLRRPSSSRRSRRPNTVMQLAPWFVFLAIAIALVGAATRGGSTAPAGIAAARVTVSIDGTPAGSVRQDPSLNLLQEQEINHLRASLPGAWAAATRGLSSLAVIDGKAFIPIHVVAASGTSVHKSGSRSGQEILLFVAEDGRRTTDEEILTTALHELGHIWCCQGQGTSEGHWSTAVDDGREFGLNRYGLMNSPVKCNTQPNKTVLCPNRFSDRELAAMGFSAPPRATPDPCVAALDRLKAQLDVADRQIRIARSDLEDLRVKLQRAESDLSFYDVYRFSGIPSGMYVLYQQQVDAYNNLASRERRDVADLNARVNRQNQIARQHDSDAARCLTD